MRLFLHLQRHWHMWLGLDISRPEQRLVLGSLRCPATHFSRNIFSRVLFKVGLSCRIADSFTSPARSSAFVENFHSFAMLFFLPARLKQSHILHGFALLFFLLAMLKQCNLLGFYISWIPTFPHRQICPSTHILLPCSGSHMFYHCRCTFIRTIIPIIKV